MTDQTGRPDDEQRPEDTPEAPAQYPPAAPYPPAGSEAGAEQPSEPASGSTASDQSPYGQPPEQSPYDRPAEPSPYDQPPAGTPYGQAPPEPSPYGQPPAAPYGQAPPEQSPYGQAPQPYGAPTTGYGQSAEYTATPQPYAYGPAALSPESEKARSNAILWTILNGVSIFACANLLAIVGVVLAAIAISKAREDVDGARRLTRWSWIAFAAGFVLWLLFIIGIVALGFAGVLAGQSEF